MDVGSEDFGHEINIPDLEIDRIYLFSVLVKLLKQVYPKEKHQLKSVRNSIKKIWI